MSLQLVGACSHPAKFLDISIRPLPLQAFIVRQQLLDLVPIAMCH